MRKSQNIKQETLAKSLNISQQNLSRYENEQRIISFEMIEKIASECGYKIYFVNKKNKDTFTTKDLSRKEHINYWFI